MSKDARGDTQDIRFRVQSLLYPKKWTEYTGWGIFNIQVTGTVTTSTGALVQQHVTARKLKGPLPVGTAPYYRFRARCFEVPGLKKGERTFVLKELLEIKRDSALTRENTRWLLVNELALTETEASCVIRDLPFVPTRQQDRHGRPVDILNHRALSPAYQKKLSQTSFFSSSLHSVGQLLVHLPGNYEEILALDPAVRDQLLTRVTANPWDFAYPGALQEYGLRAPTPLLRLVRGDQGKKTSPLETLNVRALVFYQRLRAWMDGHSHTVVFSSQLARFLRRPLFPASLLEADDPNNVQPTVDLLRDMVAHLVRNRELVELDLDGMQAYTVREYHECWARTVRSLQRIYARSAHGTLAPIPKGLAGTGAKSLNAEQRAALAAVGEAPITFIPAPPGCGKTFLLVCLQKMVGPNNFAVFAQNNCMVDELAARGIKNVFTLQSYIYHHQHQKTNKRSAAIAQRLRFYPVVALDEMSNVGLSDISYFYELCCRDAVRVVHTYDPDQVLSISPGKPCIDIPNALPHLVHKLRTNQRIYESASDSLMLENDRKMVVGRGYEMDFVELNPAESPLLLTAKLPHMDQGAAALKRGRDCFLVCPNTQSSGNAGVASLRWILERLLPREVNVKTGKEKVDLRKVQFLAVHNDTCRRVNDMVSEFHASQEEFGNKRARDRPILIPGTSFTIAEKTYYRKRIYPPLEGKARWQRDPEDENTSSTAKATDKTQVYTDKLANRGKFVYRGYRVLNLKTGKFRRNRGRDLYIAPQTKVVGEHDVLFILTACGKQFAVNHVGCVRLAEIQPAWCITLDSYQGSQNDIIITVLPSAGIFTSDETRRRLQESMQSASSPFARNHIHVASSRARKWMAYLGTREEVVQQAMRTSPPRQSLLEYWIRKGLPSAPSSHMEVETQVAEALGGETEREKKGEDEGETEGETEADEPTGRCTSPLPPTKHLLPLDSSRTLSASNSMFVES